MCMAMGGGGGSSYRRQYQPAAGWTSSSYYGYDPEREQDYSSRPDLLAMGRAGVNNQAISNVGMNWYRGWQTRERMRGYNSGFGYNRGPGPGGAPITDKSGNVLTPRTIAPKPATTSTSTPTPSAAPAPEPFDFSKLNIPMPPKAVGYTKGGSARKKQARAKSATRENKVKGKKGLTLKNREQQVNY